MIHKAPSHTLRITNLESGMRKHVLEDPLSILLRGDTELALSDMQGPGGTFLDACCETTIEDPDNQESFDPLSR